MNNNGWGLGSMLLCIGMIGLCLMCCCALILKLEHKSHKKLYDNNITYNIIHESHTILNNK